MTAPGLSQSRLLGSLPKEERERLERVSAVVELRQGDVLVSRGAPIEAAYFPLTAVTSSVVELPEGRTIEVGLMGGEGFVGLSLVHGTKRSSSTVIVQVPGSAVKIGSDDFIREVVAADGSLKLFLSRYADAFFELSTQVTACNGSHADEQRLARWLLLVQDRVWSNDFPLAPEFIGSMLGVHLGRSIAALTALKSAGAITYDYVAVHVLDRDRLLGASCRCYQSMVTTLDEVFRPHSAA
jgi:CRP-like cAMP-binding protein